MALGLTVDDQHWCLGTATVLGLALLTLVGLVVLGLLILVVLVMQAFS